MLEPFIADLSDLARLRAAVEQELSGGGLRITTDRTEPLFSQVTLIVALPTGPVRSVTGRTVAPTPEGNGFFVQIDPGDELDALKVQAARCLEEMAQKEAATLAPEPEPEPDPRPEPEPPPGEAGVGGDTPGSEKPATHQTMVPAWDLIDMGSNVPLHKQVADLRLSDKLRLARHATRPVRQLLLRDVEKRLHMEVLQNPKIADEEILDATNIRSLSPNALRWIAQQQKYTRRRHVVMNLIFNPSTPPEEAKKLLSRLSTPELLKVSRSGRVREKLQREAKRKLMKAGVI